MFSLNLPAFEAKIITRDGKRSIFDVIRRRYVALTPEEWVRITAMLPENCKEMNPLLRNISPAL